MLKINNTLTKQVEEFKPIEDGKIRFYQCGPTVYSHQHIGNLFSPVKGDLIRRALITLGYDVKYVRNITDVGHLVSDEDSGEDKLEKGAKKEGKSPEEIAKKYTDIYHKDLDELNVLPVDIETVASKYVYEMADMVQDLIDNGYAYVTDQAIYFEVSKFKDYNKLNRQKLEFNKQGAGHGNVGDPGKKNNYDFAIWFFKVDSHKNALQTWEKEFKGIEQPTIDGFPGWHIECSAMAKSALGNTIDIHMGGIEHIPTHHTNEIAQSECANGVKFTNYWLHHEWLLIDNGKMSKSIGNIYTLDDIKEKGYDPIHLRYFLLQAHYRSKQNFTWEALEAAKTGYERLVARVVKLYANTTPSPPPTIVGGTEQFSKIGLQFNDKFTASLEDDFNIPGALATTWDVLKSDLDDKTKLNTVLKFDEVLGLNLSTVGANIVRPTDAPPEIQAILDERQIARDEKDWDKADELRDKLKDGFGLKVIDGDNGQEVKKI